MRDERLGKSKNDVKQPRMAGASAEPKDKSQRQSHAKVKSGCITWLVITPLVNVFILLHLIYRWIRRVKCDETKPNCLRCTSTRRKCDGYRGKESLKFINATTISDDVGFFVRGTALERSAKVQSRPPFSTLIGSPNNPLLDFSGTELEQRSIAFFRYEAAPALSGYFDADFWNGLIPRIGFSEPAVQHAMIAVGSLYEHCINNEGYPSLIQQRYSLIQYNKAIRALKTYAADDLKTLETTLLTCLLFVCLELLGGNPEQALNHLRNGLGMLRSSERAKDRISTLHRRARENSTKTLPNPESVLEVLSDAFSRLSIQGSLCARRLPEIYPHEGWSCVEDFQSARTPFNNLQEARLSLNGIFIQCFQKLGLNEANQHSSVDGLAEKAQKDMLVQQLHYWNSRLGLWVTDSVRNLSEEEIRGSHVLRLLSIVAIIMTTAGEELSESVYDAHFESHQRVIKLALAFIEETNTTSPTTTATLSSASGSRSTTPGKRASSGMFTFEMRVIPALYFTAIKCRSPSLRRKAIEMLKKIMPQREGLWDARVLAGIADRVVEIEEAGGCSEDEWPAEAARIHGIYITPDYSLAERRQGIVFTWRPNGAEGEWQQMAESIRY